MDSSDFAAQKPGRLVRTAEGYWAFVPQPLPPPVRWDDELIHALSSADRAIGRLAGVGQNLANPHLLISPFMRREAVLSSRIEGTQSSLSDLLLFDAAPSLKQAAPDAHEVANYVRALEHALARLPKLPPSLRLIREAHKLLMKNVRGQDRTPGAFRRILVWIGPEGCSPDEATFVPPPVNEMTNALNEFEKYLHAPSQLPPLVRLAATHYQFEAIHPFSDGNGRIGRLLITLLLCAEGILPQPLLYLSAYFEKHREAYYRHFLGVSQAGRWNEWIKFFLYGVSEQAADAVRRSAALLALREQYHERCHAARCAGSVLKLVDHLVAYPVTTAARAEKLLNVTRSAASACINKLVELRILEEITGRKRHRVFVARDVIETIEAPEAPDS